MMFIICYERTKGNQSILPAWVFWAVMTVYSGLKLRTLIREWEDTAALSSELPACIIAYFALCFVNLVVYSFRELPEELLHKSEVSVLSYIQVQYIIYSQLSIYRDSIYRDGPISPEIYRYFLSKIPFFSLLRFNANAVGVT